MFAAQEDVPEGNKKDGTLFVGQSGLITLVRVNACLRHRSGQMEDKRPKALALAIACVRLWTPSLPWILL